MKITKEDFLLIPVGEKGTDKCIIKKELITDVEPQTSKGSRVYFVNSKGDKENYYSPLSAAEIYELL